MKKIFTKEFNIGLCVIVALVILFFGIDYLKGINLFKPANFYYAEYEHVDGLEIAAPVTIDGYKVGQVREIEFNYANPGKIKVLLALNKELSLPADSYAVIAQSLLGGPSIEIHVGKSKERLAVGSEIKTEVEGGLMSALSDDIMPSVTGILPKVDSLLLSLNTLAGDPALLASIQRLDVITSNVALATQGLDYTVNKQLPPVMKNAYGVSCKLDSIAVNLSELSTTLRQLPLQSTMQNVETTTANLSRFSERLNSDNSTLGLLTTDPELYYRLNRVAASVDSLIVDIKRNPKRYISIKLL